MLSYCSELNIEAIKSTDVLAARQSFRSGLGGLAAWRLGGLAAWRKI